VPPNPIHETFAVSLENKKATGVGFERRDEILAAAKELFLREGVESVSTRKLTQRVGLSQTGIYVYFQGKQASLAALIDAALKNLGAALSEVDARLRYQRIHEDKSISSSLLTGMLWQARAMPEAMSSSDNTEFARIRTRPAITLTMHVPQSPLSQLLLSGTRPRRAVSSRVSPG
jgi:AcrR family transcriptional regulator